MQLIVKAPTLQSPTQGQMSSYTVYYRELFGTDDILFIKTLNLIVLSVRQYNRYSDRSALVAFGFEPQAYIHIPNEQTNTS